MKDCVTLIEGPIVVTGIFEPGERVGFWHETDMPIRENGVVLAVHYTVEYRGHEILATGYGMESCMATTVLYDVQATSGEIYKNVYTTEEWTEEQLHERL